MTIQMTITYLSCQGKFPKVAYWCLFTHKISLLPSGSVRLNSDCFRLKIDDVKHWHLNMHICLVELFMNRHNLWKGRFMKTFISWTVHEHCMNIKWPSPQLWLNTLLLYYFSFINNSNPYLITLLRPMNIWLADIHSTNRPH